ncbi:Ribosomal RNA processing protein 36 [Liparis tanakae]|uniref:rRNA biogenesis protein RRP36 n=1 Tax=Liparis tanakae TaxID=230148 RepID=A0A4Z2F7Z3_9TELE|nr:Ribosomal RNA processing protein 36 [Liparis tanakae]
MQTTDDVKSELSAMSFEEILKLQNQVGTKVYNEVAYGSSKSRAAGRKKRLNKNRPMEISAKRRAPFLRQVVSVKKPKLKKTKTNTPHKEDLKFLLKKMDNQERARKSREEQRERELQFKRERRERANQGARPFFLKSSDKKKLELADKYEELKKSGKLETFLSKKRKRNAGKDRRKLPRQLQNERFQ